MPAEQAVALTLSQGSIIYLFIMIPVCHLFVTLDCVRVALTPLCTPVSHSAVLQRSSAVDVPAGECGGVSQGEFGGGLVDCGLARGHRRGAEGVGFS